MNTNTGTQTTTAPHGGTQITRERYVALSYQGDYCERSRLFYGKGLIVLEAASVEELGGDFLMGSHYKLDEWHIHESDYPHLERDEKNHIHFSFTDLEAAMAWVCETYASEMRSIHGTHWQV